MKWAELSKYAGFSNGVSMRNAFSKKGNKVFNFGLFVSKYYEQKIINFYENLPDGEFKALFKKEFKVIKCLNCEKEVTENELLANNDCCPHCNWEHDGDIFAGTNIYAEDLED